MGGKREQSSGAERSILMQEKKAAKPEIHTNNRLAAKAPNSSPTPRTIMNTDVITQVFTRLPSRSPSTSDRAEGARFVGGTSAAGDPCDEHSVIHGGIKTRGCFTSVKHPRRQRDPTFGHKERQMHRIHTTVHRYTHNTHKTRHRYGCK